MVVVGGAGCGMESGGGSRELRGEGDDVGRIAGYFWAWVRWKAEDGELIPLKVGEEPLEDFWDWE